MHNYLVYVAGALVDTRHTQKHLCIYVHSTYACIHTERIRLISPGIDDHPIATQT